MRAGARAADLPTIHDDSYRGLPVESLLRAAPPAKPVAKRRAKPAPAAVIKPKPVKKRPNPAVLSKHRVKTVKPGVQLVQATTALPLLVCRNCHLPVRIGEQALVADGAATHRKTKNCEQARKRQRAAASAQEHAASCERCGHALPTASHVPGVVCDVCGWPANRPVG